MLSTSLKKKKLTRKEGRKEIFYLMTDTDYSCKYYYLLPINQNYFI